MGSVSGDPGPSDAWVTLGGLARDTTTIRLGTLVTAATFRHPGPLAISVANVDQMSGGRVELGLGAGWYEAEHSAYGIPFPALGERFDRFTEQLAIIDGMWQTPAGETFSYSGNHWSLTDSPALPKPVQSGGIPIIIGGRGAKRTPALTAAYAAEFNMPFTDLSTFAAQTAVVRGACEAIGRHPTTLRGQLRSSPAWGAPKMNSLVEPKQSAGSPTNYDRTALPGRQSNSSTRSRNGVKRGRSGSTSRFSIFPILTTSISSHRCSGSGPGPQL